ncbi:MAG: beta-ketoacyl synthase N-terminal-like domain-containing protein [Aurantibacter sp.]
MNSRTELSEPISITAISSVSPLGISSEEAWTAYQSPKHRFTQKEFVGGLAWVAPITKKAKQEIEILRKSDAKYKDLDDSVLYGIYASRRAVYKAGWNDDTFFGINIGSSRGATSLFERYHEEFVQKSKASTLSSPTTTLGNISSWIAHDLQSKGPEISHSITCSTALHAVLNGLAWIKSGMADKFLVGGSEAPLTSFTLAQMKALKIYARPVTKRTLTDDRYGQSYPCRTLDLAKTRNTMILGEGAAVACLEQGKAENALAVIEGVGYATEILDHNVSISAEAKCFQRSMQMALGDLDPQDIDVIVMHAPGTIKGDSSEYKAIEKVFGNKAPFLTSNKWKIGHTFGASGMLGIEMAILMLQNQEIIKVPFVASRSIPKKINKIMINAVGFGGNAVSILVGRV